MSTDDFDPRLGPAVDGLNPPTFQHPPWTVGVVLVFAVVALLFGILVRPIWLLVGSPFILTLFVWIGVRFTQWQRRRRA
ncbi:MAG TPA: hypothetical protein QGG47_00630 [Acidobacteriota bacterium]|nr:hypothetical protein [Acidobacteriota bacterium]